MYLFSSVCVCVNVDNLFSSFLLNADGNDYFNSRTILILKGGNDVMKRGRASLLKPLHSHHRWKRQRERQREREME